MCHLANLVLCFFFLQFQISIKDQIPKYFQAETVLVTTQCIILEAEALGSKVQGATGIVKQFLVHKCGHEKGPKSGIACIKSMVNILVEHSTFMATFSDFNSINDNISD